MGMFSDVRHFAELAAASKLSLMDDGKKDGFSKGFLGYQGYRDQLDKWGRDYMGGDEAHPGRHAFDFPCSVTDAGAVHCSSGMYAVGALWAFRFAQSFVKEE